MDSACTPAEIRLMGLLLVNYTRKQIQKAKTKRNVQWFVGHFGASPAVMAQMWEDLQTTTIASARVSSGELDVNSFLMAMHYLK